MRVTIFQSYWDTEIVHYIGSNPSQVAAQVLQPFQEKEEQWEDGGGESWARESFRLAPTVGLPCGARATQSWCSARDDAGAGTSMTASCRRIEGH
jgi:hypothetical protein